MGPLDVAHYFGVTLNTGMRLGEVMGLRWNDVDFGSGTITVSRTKNGSGRMLPLSRASLDALRSRVVTKAVMNPMTYIFQGPGTRPDTIQRLFSKALKLSGLKGFCFHSLRHTFASHLASNGCDIMVLKELLGHKTLAMTLRYAHLFPDRKRKAVEMLDRVFGKVSYAEQSELWDATEGTAPISSCGGAVSGRGAQVQPTPA